MSQLDGGAANDHWCEVENRAREMIFDFIRAVIFIFIIAAVVILAGWKLFELIGWL